MHIPPIRTLVQIIVLILACEMVNKIEIFTKNTTFKIILPNIYNNYKFILKFIILCYIILNSSFEGGIHIGN